MNENPYFYKNVAKNYCTRCLFDDRMAVIHDDGECEYCKLHNSLEENAGNWDKELVKIRSQKGKYNCLIGISGGLDSSTLLWCAVKHWGLRPLVIHFNNNYNSKEAKHNIKRLIDVLGVDFIMYRVNKHEYDMVNLAFLEAGVIDADIPNDIAMAKLMYEASRQYGIKYILNGHDFRTEGSTPKLWTRMDSTYIQSVFNRSYPGVKLKNFPLYTFKDQVMQSLLGIRQVRPFHFYEVHGIRGVFEREMKKAIGWKDYGGKHAENIYTEFVGSKLLPQKFGVDKRIVYLSARVRSGDLTREQALEIYLNPPTFDNSKLEQSNWTRNYVYDNNIVPREKFRLFPFKKYKWLIWIMAELGIVPYTFYKKYAS